jgi:trimethylamine---corrinoid protein Co-methyltransferase
MKQALVPKDAAQRIHEASLSLLEDPGIRLEHDDVCRMLIARGARSGSAADVVRIPRDMVREALDLCPREVALADKSGRAITLAADSNPVFWSVPGMSIWKGDSHRPFTSVDMAETARLLEQLENVSVIFGLAMEDVPPGARDVKGLEVMAANSRKHLRVLCFTADGASILKEMKQVVGPYPWFSIGFTAHGPLRWTRLALDIFRRSAGAGIPVTVNGEPMAGTSGPITLAGSAAVGNAEILAGLVVNQILEPGRPCIYNLGLAHVFDMRTAIAVTGGPENALLAHLAAEMGRFYGLPSASWVSTEAMMPDSQAALEKMLGFHTHADAGVSAIWGVGQLESEMTFSPAQAVIDDEMISYIRSFQRGVVVDRESLALEVTRKVGIGGSFLEAQHTLERCRSEFFYPRLLCRKRRAQWLGEGGLRLDQKAEMLAQQLARRPVKNDLSELQAKELARIADRQLVRAKSG